MKRREFLHGGAAAALGLCLGTRLVIAHELQAEVTTVYVVAKCHLDMGFTDFEHNVVATYFNDYIPAAIQTSRGLEQAGGEERFVWTLGSWMVYEYLEQAQPADRKTMEDAITKGWIAWHAYPFTWYSEMVDRSLMLASFNISKTLDKRFGVTTIAGKLTDVPGHTRSIVGPAAEAGVQFIDIGADFRPADVPPDPHLFRWRDTDGAEVTVLYHPLSYGGVAVLPGTGIAIAINVRGDNSGPYTIEEVKKYYTDLSKQFPTAKIVATNLNTVAKAVVRVKNVPVVTQEMGDTWVYGIASDPYKVAQYRELSRLRLEWLAQKKVAFGDSTDFAFSRKLILIPEHNWGLDTGAVPNAKTLVYYKDINSPDELTLARAHNPVFQKYELGWDEKRGDIELAVKALPEPLRIEAQSRLASLVPVAPDTSRFKPQDVSKTIEAEHFILAFDPEIGAIIRLLDRKNGREWASAQHPLAFYRYQTFTGADTVHYVEQYTSPSKPDWQINAWGKPFIDKYPCQSREWEPEVFAASMLETSQEHRIVLQLRMPTKSSEIMKVIGWPAKLIVEVALPKAIPEILVTLYCFEKRANRLPEAMWFSFSPNVPRQEGWQLEKINRPVSPLDVMSSGARHLHAVSNHIGYHDENGTFMVQTLDAPLVAPGQRSLADFNNRVPDMREGVHINLFNNLWNTAFMQWCDDDMRFRFILSFPDDPSSLKFF